jgi:hypothetical protein
MLIPNFQRAFGIPAIWKCSSTGTLIYRNQADMWALASLFSRSAVADCRVFDDHDDAITFPTGNQGELDRPKFPSLPRYRQSAINNVWPVIVANPRIFLAEGVPGHLKRGLRPACSDRPVVAQGYAGARARLR